MESLQTTRAISSTARRHGISRSLLMTWRRSFSPEPTGTEAQQAGFVPAMVVATETAPTESAAPASGRMEIIIGRDRRIIVDAGVDAAALARVLQVLERR
jgi:transposase